jgi:hypothetical protein
MFAVNMWIKNKVTFGNRIKAICICIAAFILPVIVNANDKTQEKKPIHCKTGIYIKTIKIHESEELFEVLFYYWLRIDSMTPDIDTAEITSIEFVNADESHETFYTNHNKEKGVFYTVGRCKANIPYKANYTRFPFDVQSLEISLESMILNSNKLVFVPDNLTNPINQIKKSGIEILNGDEFKIKELLASSGNYTYETTFGDPEVKNNDAYSRIVYTVKMKRDPLGMVQKILIPLLVVLVLAYLVFFIPDYEIGTAAGLTVTALLAAIAFQWTLSDSLPKVSYLTLIDKIFYLVYVYIFYAMMQTVFTFNLNKKGENMAENNPELSSRYINLSHKIEWHSRYLFPLTFILWLIILLF